MDKKVPVQDRLYFSPEVLLYAQPALLKAIELVMEMEIPPPFYLSADVVEDNFVVVAVPAYDYGQLVDSAKESDLFDVGDEYIEYLYTILPMAFMGSYEKSPNKGKTTIIGGILHGARVYASISTMDDLRDTDPIRYLLEE